MLKKCKLWYVALALLSSVVSFAQNITKSPYSALGLGEAQFGGSATLHGMAQLSQGVRLQGLLNTQNPASYSALQTAVWDVGGIGTFGTISSSTQSGGVSNASFAYLTAGFRLSQKRGWGLSFGIMPYTGVGYSINRNVVTSTFTATEENKAQGGLSRFYLGTGFRITPKWSAGVNAGYTFGKIAKVTFLNIPASYNMFNLVENRDRYLDGFVFDLALQYADTFSVVDKSLNIRRYRFSAGVTVTPMANLNAVDDYNVRTLGVGVTKYQSIGKDTVANNNNDKGTISMPMSIRGGLFFQEIDHWGIGVDGSYTAWKDYRAFGSSDSLKNSFGFQIGAFYKHNDNKSKSYFNQVEYRAGMRFDNGTISTQGKNVSSIGFSVGLGLPIDKVISKVNISAEYLLRGTTEQNLLREEYFRLVIGVSISDNQWFRRYKYD